MTPRHITHRASHLWLPVCQHVPPHNNTTTEKQTTAPPHQSSMLAAAAAAAGKAVPSSLWSAAALSNSWRLLARSYADAAGGEVINVQSQTEYDGILQQLADDGAVGIIDFTAKWCGPCKAIAPIYEQLAKQYPQARFLKVDIDNAALEAVVADHGITGVPTFTMYKGSRKVETFTGARVDLLRAVLKKHAS